jgi:TRCF domain
MYTKLLEETVRELKGEEVEDDVRATVNLRVDLKIDDDYIADMNQRLTVYRRIASARSDSELDRVVGEVRDRYGPLPTSILNLTDYGRIRIMADRLGIESIDREGDKVVFRFRPQTKLDPAQLVGFIQRRNDLTLVPPAGLRLDLRASRVEAGLQPRGGGATRATGAPGAAGAQTAAWPDLGRKPLTSDQVPRTRRTEPAPAGSWWTARATAGEVTRGFTKAEILRPEKEDPRAPGGVFTRVGDLLRDLLR